MILYKVKQYLNELSFFKKKPPEKELSTEEYAAILKAKFPAVNKMISIQAKLNYYHKNKLTPPTELLAQYREVEDELDGSSLVDIFLQDIEVTKRLKLHSYLRSIKEFEKMHKDNK